ncbi:MAG: Rho termination factor N-terminal domain-containing protein, partial [Candidatus Izemoplasmataceae bacterium]
KSAPKKVEPKVETKVADKFEDKTVVELREIAKEAGLTGYSKLKKAELIEALRK